MDSISVDDDVLQPSASIILKKIDWYKLVESSIDFLTYKSGLRFGTFNTVDNQQDTVTHVKHTLN